MTTGSNVLAQALGTFMEEANELLAQMEAILLRAETGFCSDDDLNALFRCAHTIKGSGGLFGLDEVVRFTHVVENVLDRVLSVKLQDPPSPAYAGAARGRCGSWGILGQGRKVARACRSATQFGGASASLAAGASARARAWA